MFKPLENNRPFLKMAFEGFAGDGKTYTAVQVAIGLHQRIGSTKPIAIFDTEKASKALLDIFDAAGVKAIAIDDQRSLTSLSEAITECERGAADILIIDSITHVWEEFLQNYMKQKGRSRLQFEDWGVIKPRWKQDFSNRFVQANVHIIFTGRAGYEYTDEKNEETGKREIFKSGIKMKAENETAFEPDILVLMEKNMELLGEKKKVSRVATVIKDRTARIDGLQFTNPTYNDFKPAIEGLLAGQVKQGGINPVIVDRFENTEEKRAGERKERERLTSEIEGIFAAMGLGSAAKDKQVKAWTLKSIFGYNSLEMLDKVKIDALKAGLETMIDFSEKYMEYFSHCNETGETPSGDYVKKLMEQLTKSEI